MPDAPVFTLESANALLPQLNLIIGEQMQRRDLLEVKMAALTALLGKVPDALDPTADDLPEVADLRAEASALLAEYRRVWEEIEELGVVLKDPRRGLVDFYGHVDGKLVWLCWQYGEAEVSHYHRLEEGFPGRKAIVQAARQRLLN
jgi:hypothetical protein